MKRLIWIYVLALLLALAGCKAEPVETEPASEPVPTTAPPSGWQADGSYLSPTGDPVRGWLKMNGECYYLDENGKPTTGWLDADGIRYHFASDGTMSTGWTEIDGTPYFFNDDGTPYSGWLGTDGGKYYFDATGAAHTGWLEFNDQRYYLDEQGILCTGWLELDGAKYYLDSHGAACTGWLELDGRTFYMKPDGAMARGQVEIDGVNHFFTSTGAPILVVNPWNYVPEGYEPDLVTVRADLSVEGSKVDRSCYEALVQMMDDCNANSGAKVCIVSSYRTHAYQTRNYNRKVDYWKGKGYNEEDAKAKAATSVAVPGTSEHQLGLAVDIIDTSLWNLVAAQADTKGQKWLMEHCWDYGFILRYPEDKIDVTGIIYEPWHYRYVGKELAAELKESGLTLEEYIQSLS